MVLIHFFYLEFFSGCSYGPFCKYILVFSISPVHQCEAVTANAMTGSLD